MAYQNNDEPLLLTNMKKCFLQNPQYRKYWLLFTLQINQK